MTDFPSTHAAFVKWLASERANMPDDLIAKAEVAAMLLYQIEANPPGDLEKLRENQEAVKREQPDYKGSYDSTIGALREFAEAYSAWRATRG